MNGQSSAELEREAEAARASVAETADAIRSKMTPGQMIDEFTGIFAGGDGESALNNLKAQIRDNPLPLTLVGAGLAWLMLGSGTASQKAPKNDNVQDIPKSVNMDRGAHLEVDEHNSGLGERVSDATAEIQSKAGGLVSSARERIGAVGNRTSSSAKSVAGQAADIAAKSKSGALDVLEKEPLILAAFGVAVGTAIGVLLPHSSLEDEQLGSISTNVRAQAEELLGEGVSEAKNLAADAYQTMKDEADQQGLRSDGTVVDKVTEVLKSTVRTAEGSVREKLSGQNSDDLG
jgi:hypothetical protein